MKLIICVLRLLGAGSLAPTAQERTGVRRTSASKYRLVWRPRLRPPRGRPVGHDAAAARWMPSASASSPVWCISSTMSQLPMKGALDTLVGHPSQTHSRRDP